MRGCHRRIPTVQPHRYLDDIPSRTAQYPGLPTLAPCSSDSHSMSRNLQPEHSDRSQDHEGTRGREVNVHSLIATIGAVVGICATVAGVSWWLRGASDKTDKVTDKVDKVTDKVDKVAGKVDNVDTRLAKVELPREGPCGATVKPAIGEDRQPRGHSDNQLTLVAPSKEPPKGCSVHGEGLRCRFGNAIENVSRKVLKWACGNRPTQSELDVESGVIAVASQAPVCRESSGQKRLIVKGRRTRFVYVPPVDCRQEEPPVVEDCMPRDLEDERGDSADHIGGGGDTTDSEESGTSQSDGQEKPAAGTR
jgi:hypothetical protein